MRSHRCLPAVIGCLVVLGLVGCDGGGVVGGCGDGVVQDGEECDGTDLSGARCADLLPNGSGTLACNPNCTFDTTECQSPRCGNGNREFGEECDCGTDPGSLPEDCTDVNGGAHANCDADCNQLDLCGDGIRTGNEECDCGDPTLIDDLPSYCTNWNGESESECYEDCTDNGGWPCAEVMDECDPLVGGMCCPDEWGVEIPCSALPDPPGGNVCIRHCQTTDDCYWNNWCLGPDYFDICWFAVCGPGGDIDSEMNQLCQVPDGAQGFCWPYYRRNDPNEGFVGLCIEPGTIPHGGVCQMRNAIDLTDRSEDMCDYGICLGYQGAIEGTCAAFCDWEAAYAVAFYGAVPSTEILPCPTGSNCFSESGIACNPANANHGIRSGDLSYCRDTAATDPTNGMTTCSLITGQLLSDPTSACDSTGFLNGRCVMVQFGSGDLTDGTLVGVCADSQAASLNVWAPCDPASANDVCPGGTACVEQDVFATTPAGPTRCVPFCDTEHPDGPEQHCADLGAVPTAGGTPTCRTQSDLWPPNGPLDVSPTRLGYCAL